MPQVDAGTGYQTSSKFAYWTKENSSPIEAREKTRQWSEVGTEGTWAYARTNRRSYVAGNGSSDIENWKVVEFIKQKNLKGYPSISSFD